MSTWSCCRAPNSRTLDSFRINSSSLARLESTDASAISTTVNMCWCCCILSANLEFALKDQFIYVCAAAYDKLWSIFSRQSSTTRVATKPRLSHRVSRSGSSATRPRAPAKRVDLHQHQPSMWYLSILQYISKTSLLLWVRPASTPSGSNPASCVVCQVVTRLWEKRDQGAQEREVAERKGRR